MFVLEYLPTEILRQIVSCLDSPDLVGLCLVSHFFNGLAEPFLYASLGSWLTPGLRAIVARPALSRHVRFVDCGWWAENDIDPRSGDCARFSTAARDLGLADPPWLLGLPDTLWTEDEQALLLLHLVPNIRHLCINRSRLIPNFIESTLTLPIASLPFKSLRKFHADEYSQCSSVSLTLFLALSRFPSLREVVVDLEFAKEYTHPPSVLDDIIASAGLSPITHLSLHFGNTSPSMLAHILRLPRALTHFSYADDGQYPYMPDKTSLWSALRVVRRTLQSLSLGALTALRLGEPDGQTIGALCDWTVLTTLRCSLPALLGMPAVATARLVDVLPKGIRELEIRRTDKRGSLRSRGQYTVALMTEQLVEVLQNSELMRLTVDTCEARLSIDTGVNDDEGEMRRHLAAVGGVSGRCEVIVDGVREVYCERI